MPITLKREEPHMNDAFRRFWGAHAPYVEHALYVAMDKVCPDYKGGYWHTVTLPDGTPLRLWETEQYTVHGRNEGAFFEGPVSPDMASLAANVLALHLVPNASEVGHKLNQVYFAIRDYVFDDNSELDEEERNQYYQLTD